MEFGGVWVVASYLCKKVFHNFKHRNKSEGIKHKIPENPRGNWVFRLFRLTPRGNFATLICPIVENLFICVENQQSRFNTVLVSKKEKRASIQPPFQTALKTASKSPKTIVKPRQILEKLPPKTRKFHRTNPTQTPFCTNFSHIQKCFT